MDQTSVGVIFSWWCSSTRILATSSRAGSTASSRPIASTPSCWKPRRRTRRFTPVPSTGCYPHSVLTLAKTALPIVFYDGDCGMCTQSVDLILRADRRNVFWFAPLQGETARELLPPLPDDPGQWSMVLVDEAGVHRESDAALRICQRL